MARRLVKVTWPAFTAPDAARGSGSAPVDDLTSAQRRAHATERADVLGRIAVEYHHIGVEPGRESPRARGGTECAAGAVVRAARRRANDSPACRM